LEITCPNCGKSLPYVPQLAGRELFCLGCGRQFTVAPANAPEASPDTSNIHKVQFPTRPGEIKKQ
jgi:hypothetical protein